jgi:signal transduction histidine kinase
VLDGVSVDVIESALEPSEDIALLDAAEPDHPLDGYTALGYGPLMVARVGRPELNALVVCGRLRGRRTFDSAHRAIAEEFASVVLVALDLDRARAALERLAVISDLERIGRDLHDTVIQRLFAAGIRLEATAQLAKPAVAERLHEVIHDLNTVAAEIRATIFGLQRDPPGVPLDEVVRQLVDDFAAPAALVTSVSIDPDLDDRLHQDVRHHMLTAVRECLANVVRHANASRLDVSITGRHGHLTVTVVDDGIGPHDLAASGGHGIRNLAARATALGGNFCIEPGEHGGAVATWTAEID